MIHRLPEPRNGSFVALDGIGVDSCIGCLACHRIESFDALSSIGHDVGIDLDDLAVVGAKKEEPKRPGIERVFIQELLNRLEVVQRFRHLLAADVEHGVV